MSFSFGLIGYGHFGAFLHDLARRYLPGSILKIHSSRREPDGTRFFHLDEVAACDAVVLAVPISAYPATLEKIRPHLGSGSVVVDVATVKKYTMDLLQAVRPSCRFLAMHPMFGPESYAKRDGDVSGFRVVVTGHNLSPPQFAKFAAKLTEIGFALVEKSAEAHASSGFTQETMKTVKPCATAHLTKEFFSLRSRM